ncbi:MAG: PA2817 family protein [Pseudomonadales bacterium]|jgi:hypothetical protein|nr:PA2817 family protein [Pseudomonadales bacterium]
MADPSTIRPRRVTWALETLRGLYATALRSPRFGELRGEQDERFLARFERLCEALANGSADYEFEGRELLGAMQAGYPELWAALDRRLLFFFGGECLHFLDDAELDLFQAESEAEG